MTTQIEELSKLPNLGKVLVAKLTSIGVKNVDQLKKLGTENTFIKLKNMDNDACLNMLYALEGAIQGIRWHNLDKSKKEELKDFFRMIKK